MAVESSDMHYRRLGATGLRLSALSLGTWITFGGVLRRGQARELVARALDAGINCFDSAENYAHGRAEALLGDLLADLRTPRDRFCLSNKAFFGPIADPAPTQRGLSRKHLRDACDAALKRLRVEYLDIFHCHRSDPDTPLEETVAAMDQLVRAGKILYWGTSEWPAGRIREAIRIARSGGMAEPVAEQAQYNLLHRRRVEREYEPLRRHHGYGLTVTSPLLSGLLTGKYLDGAVPPDSRLERAEHGWRASMMRGPDPAAREALVRRFVGLAGAWGLPPAVLALAWCLRRPGVDSVILGCSSPAQLEENLRALGVAQGLDGEQLAALDALADDPAQTRE